MRARTEAPYTGDALVIKPIRPVGSLQSNAVTTLKRDERHVDIQAANHARAQPTTFRPTIGLDGTTIRFLIDQIRTIDVKFIQEDHESYLDKTERATTHYLGCNRSRWAVDLQHSSASVARISPKANVGGLMWLLGSRDGR